tara:strand:- start:3831 stop:4097 length:267 start_codon:yes stop_codon:yes gene_type:complete
MKIKMTKQEYQKIKNTKTSYKLTSNTIEDIDNTTYGRITKDETLKWFRRLGGSETAQRSYTCRGYNITKLISTSPDKQTKIIRTFQFA